MIKFSMPETQERLPELLTAARSGEVVEIQENGCTFLLTAVQPRPPRPRPPITGIPKAGRLKGLIEVPDDFDEPLEDLREYME